MRTVYGDDFKCPHCDQGLEVDDWDNEYNDPIPGDHVLWCPACTKSFELRVYISVSYCVSKE